MADIAKAAKKGDRYTLLVIIRDRLAELLEQSDRDYSGNARLLLDITAELELLDDQAGNHNSVQMSPKYKRQRMQIG